MIAAMFAHHVRTLEQVMVYALLGIHTGIVPILERQDAVDEAVVGGQTCLEGEGLSEYTTKEVSCITTDPAKEESE